MSEEGSRPHSYHKQHKQGEPLPSVIPRKPKARRPFGINAPKKPNPEVK